MTRHLRRRDAFTLVELLIVIAIIAILASILFPAGQSAINSARKVATKNQVVQIATAITAYESEYGHLPAFTGSTMTPGNVNMLLATDTTNNPRGINFLDVAAWKFGKGGTNENGFCDPFANANVYQFAIDTNYVNQISVPTDASGASTTTITKHIGIWTTPKIGKTNVLVDSWE